jgi:peptide/nickel transport system substrate-binding protein
MVQQQIAKAGFKVKLVNEEQAKLISDAIGGNFQAMTFRNHSGDDPDGQYVWWYKGTGNPVNFGRINDPVIDKLLDEGRSELDPAKRQLIYQNLNREFASKVWNIWLSYTPWAVVEGPKVHGILGPDLPDGGGKPFTGLANGHPVLGMWISR